MPFQLPQHPNSGRKNPFVGEDGKNPFSDTAAKIPADESAVSSVAKSGGVTHRPDDFVTTMSHRGGRILVFGLLGGLAAVTGFGSFLVAIFGNFAFVEQAFFALSATSIFGLIASWSTWMAARHDLNAMRHGAMDSRGRTATRWGGLFAMIGTLAALGAMAFVAIQVAREIAAEL